MKLFFRYIFINLKLITQRGIHYLLNKIDIILFGN